MYIINYIIYEFMNYLINMLYVSNFNSSVDDRIIDNLVIILQLKYQTRVIMNFIITIVSYLQFLFILFIHKCNN